MNLMAVFGNAKLRRKRKTKGETRELPLLWGGTTISNNHEDDDVTWQKDSVEFIVIVARKLKSATFYIYSGTSKQQLMV